MAVENITITNDVTRVTVASPGPKGATGGGGGGGDVATDTIWNAAGDLVVGTGPDAAARLAIGTSGQVLTVSGGTAAWATVSGTVTVTTVSVVGANGVSGSVATATTTPAITLTLGAITPTSVNGVTFSGSATPTLAVTGTSTISGTHSGTSSGTNTGDNAVNTLYSGLVSNATHNHFQYRQRSCKIVMENYRNLFRFCQEKPLIFVLSE